MAYYNKNKKVRFGNLTIAEYAIVLGDNPCVTDGLPIQLGWNIQATNYRNLDLFEHFRASGGAQRPRRLTKERRSELLLKSGVTPEEMKECEEELTVCQKLREETLREVGIRSIENVPKEILKKMLRSAGRTIRRSASFTWLLPSSPGRGQRHRRFSASSA